MVVISDRTTVMGSYLMSKMTMGFPMGIPPQVIVKKFKEVSHGEEDAKANKKKRMRWRKNLKQKCPCNIIHQ